MEVADLNTSTDPPPAVYEAGAVAGDLREENILKRLSLEHIV